MDKQVGGPVAIGAIPPFTAGRCFYVLRAPRNDTIEAHIVNPFVTAVLTHWDQDANTRLNHKEEDCRICARLGPPRWYGYIAVTRHPRYGIELAELTAFAADRCRPVAVSVKGLEVLRGRMLYLRRGGRNPRGKVHCEVSPGEAARTFALPPPIDQYGALVRLFQFRPCLAPESKERAAEVKELPEGGAQL